MPNTVYGPFAATNVVNGVTAANAVWGNNVQTQASVALHGFNGDLLTPFVLSGCVATRNGTNLKQLDVTAGSVYIRMSDNTVGLIATIASVTNQFLTSTPSTTYFLDINPDGAWSFATTHSAVTNHLTIASCTTDASGNILAVTDARVTSTTLLPTMAGQLAVNPGLSLYYTNVGGSNYGAVYKPLNTTAAQTEGHVFQTWNGTALSNAFSVGSANPGVSGMFIKDSGAVGMVGSQATAGSFGVPVIVASVFDQSVTTTSTITLFSLSVPAGLYEIFGAFSYNNTTAQKVTFSFSYTPRVAGSSPGFLTTFTSATTQGSLDGVTVTCSAQDFACPPQTFRASAGTLTVAYRDGGGAPNDLVSCVVTRLA